MSLTRCARVFAALLMIVAVFAVGASTVGAAAPKASAGPRVASNAHTTVTEKAAGAHIATISPPTQVLPFVGGPHAVTINAVGDGSSFVVCQQINNGPQQIFAFSPSGAAISQATVNSSGVGIINQSSVYTYSVFAAPGGTLPAACPTSGFLAQTRLSQANPLGDIGFADVEALFGQGGTPANPAGSGPPIAPGASCGGGFANGQFVGSSVNENQSAGCGTVADNYTFFTLSRSPLTSFPRTFYIAFDAGSKLDGSQTPAMNIKVQLSQGQFVGPAIQGPTGIYQVNYFNDGSTLFEGFDTVTGAPFSAEATTINVDDDNAAVNNGTVGVPPAASNTTAPGAAIKTDSTSYSGGTNAVINFSGDLGDGGANTRGPQNTEQALVCLFNNSPTQAQLNSQTGNFNIGAFNARSAAVSSNGAVSQNSISNLPAGDYTLAIYQVDFTGFLGGIGGRTITSGAQPGCGGLNALGLPGQIVAPTDTVGQVAFTRFTITA